MTHNVATALACHIDPSNLDLGHVESEERRRCWAGLRMLYTIHNINLGAIDPDHAIACNVQLPADINDIDITENGVFRSSSSGPTQMSYLLFKFKLYTLTTKICQKTFGSSIPTHEVVQDLDRQICLAQEECDARYQIDSLSRTLPTYHAVHLHILHAYTYQLFLLLHRPFFAQSILGFEVPNTSQVRCIASAEALLDIHRTLSETTEYKPYMWYTNGLGGFHAFHAAVVLAVASMMPIYNSQYDKFKSILDATLARFERAANRSKICERSARTLRFLMWAPIFLRSLNF